MIEETLILLKPDLIKKGLEFRVLERIQNKGFEILEMYKDSPPEEILREHYNKVIAENGEEVGRNILNFVTSGPIIIARVRGNDAVSQIRKLCGEKTQAKDCPIGTIRYDFSNDSSELANLESRGIHNAIHSSDSQESAKFEIDLWFSRYNPKLRKPDNIYMKISEILGYEMGDLIKDIIDNSNSQELLYHGIKNPSSIDDVLKEGIKPLTPEGGQCSFWSTGLSVFYPPRDSVLFDWSGSKVSDEKTELNIAVAQYEKLRRELGEINVPAYEPNSQLRIHKTIPRSCFDLLRVKLRHPEATDMATERKYRQIAEKEMLAEIIAYTSGPCSDLSKYLEVKI